MGEALKNFDYRIGDEIIFCKDEDEAFECYLKSIDETHDPLLVFEPLDEALMTKVSSKCGDIKGQMCHPLYIGHRKFGFFGYRRKRYGNSEGHFFLYEMEED